MIRLRRKKWLDKVVENDGSSIDSDVLTKKDSPRFLLWDYCKLLFYCMLLIVPLYAAVNSVINQDWLMLAIDVLLVPVGFVHGLLLISGYVS